MADIKLDHEEMALFNEVGSRGDYFREATMDRAAQQVNETGRMSEVTNLIGTMVDAVLVPDKTSIGETVTDVVPPSDFISVVGIAPGADPEPPKAGFDKDVSGA